MALETTLHFLGSGKCPFCGSSYLGVLNDVGLAVVSPNQAIYYVMCVDCRARGPLSATRDGAVEQWLVMWKASKQLTGGINWYDMRHFTPENKQVCLFIRKSESQKSELGVYFAGNSKEGFFQCIYIRNRSLKPFATYEDENGSEWRIYSHAVICYSPIT